MGFPMIFPFSYGFSHDFPMLKPRAPGLLRRARRGVCRAGGAALGRRGAAALAKAPGERQGDPVPPAEGFSGFGTGFFLCFLHINE